MVSDKRLDVKNGAVAVVKAMTAMMELHDKAIGATLPARARALSTWEPLIHILDGMLKSGHLWIEPVRNGDSTGARFAVGNKFNFAQADLFYPKPVGEDDLLAALRGLAEKSGEGKAMIAYLPADDAALRALTRLPDEVAPLGVVLAPLSAAIKRR